MNCVVFHSDEDPWFLEKQRENIKKLYGEDLLVASHKNATYRNPEILVPNAECSFPGCIFKACQYVLRLMPKNTLFFEGDMIPVSDIKGSPFVREWAKTIWPGALYTGGIELDLREDWGEHKDVRHCLSKLPVAKISPVGIGNFQTIGDPATFIHVQAGCRGRKHTERINLFKKYVHEFEARKEG